MNVLITGASRGLGCELCGACAKAGHRVFAGVLERADASALKAAAADLPGIGILPMDVADRAQVLEAAVTVNHAVGKLDALVNVAGILCDSDRTLPITNADPDDLELAFRVNVLGAANVIHAFQDMIVPGGWFIDITSEGGSLQNVGTTYPAYSVTKAAENKLVAIFRRMNPDFRVYAMHPGRMNTEMGREFAQIEPSESAEAIRALVTGERVVSAEADWFIDYLGRPMEV